jgi:hypothetical protein
MSSDYLTPRDRLFLTGSTVSILQPQGAQYAIAFIS